MDLTLIVAIVFIAVLALGIIIVLFWSSSPGQADGGRQQGQVSDRLRTLVVSQRHRTEQSETIGRNKENLAIVAAMDTKSAKKDKVAVGARYELAKKLRFAGWPISPWQFRAIKYSLTAIVLLFTWLKFKLPIQLMVLILVPSICNGFLKRASERKAKAFDKDYPSFLLSYVSLLKTGMNTITGLDAAAKGLDPDSVVRSEAELLVERLRLGLTEEQAINGFGEDVAHPEIELFVQSLLLSRRVGGQLSSTLERLAKQVRKRQEFRDKANAAVGMERGSTYVIAVIMTLLFLFLSTKSPDLVKGAFEDEKGQNMFQAGIFFIGGGLFVDSKRYRS